ncbi:ras guanine nucleotide exchange factor domain-containing protein [Phascolomyces articulosus]|uniref:Ras guanine nucleotide exchange factor domain-containing protein n=1 Tax=Phascolomyces articulosus TaxID=60185 RepID=A0AAD5PE91_9FUNG|nr:ras guanine nucleotide exchange factor domain-containing protein [Phascolomyces articulosus]
MRAIAPPPPPPPTSTPAPNTLSQFMDDPSSSWRPPLPDDPPFQQSSSSLPATNTTPPKPLPRSPSRQTSVRRTSVIDSSEPLTWNKLSAHIALSIHNLNSAAKNAQRTLFIPYAATIVNAIRMMLVTSGTIDKESIHIKTNSVLRSHHRAMMASMSKLVLSSQLSADSSDENIGKMLSDSSELLLAVRNFVQTCQDIPVSVQHMDPALITKESHLYGKGGSDLLLEDNNSNTNDQSRNSNNKDDTKQRAKYALQSDLAENLEAYGTSMQESIDAMLSSIHREDGQESSRFSLAALMFTQFRNLANQTAQFIGIVQDIDFNGVDASPLMLELKADRQQLSDGLGLLFCWMQCMTDEMVNLKEVVEDMEQAAIGVSVPIRNICSCVGKLVTERRMSMPPTEEPIPVKPSSIGGSTNVPNSAALIETAIEEEEETESVTIEGFSTDDNTTHEGTLRTESLSELEHQQQKALPNSTTPSTVLESPTSSQAGSTTTSGTAGAGGENSPSLQRSSTVSGSGPPSSPSKATNRKLKKFFGDDAPAAVAAAAKPPVNERPWYLEYDYDVNEIVFNMEGYVKGGTLPGLVERLTLHDYLDMNFINTFLLTYRSFCTSIELLDLLEARYNLKPPEGMNDEETENWTQKKLKLVRLRVFNVLKNWLELYYNEDDHIILDRLQEFTNTSIRSTLSFSADQLERLIKMRKEDESQGGLKKMILTLPDPPEPILPRKKFKLMDIDTLEMARQLTIMDFKLYSSIRPVECLDKAWSRDSNDEAGNVAVNIRASIEYCNEVTSWVSDAILSQSDIKKRSNVIKYWVQVAEKCRLLNNFNTCMAVLSAFDNSSVGRLKRTWEMVGARTNQILSQIRKLMGANRNFTEYRAIIHSINPPCIPFLGIYLQDLTFIEDGNPNYLKKSKELINFAKRAKTAEVIREIQQYQSSLYRLKPVDELQSFIQANLQSTRDEEQLYNESLKLEPREREDEKITRLLQESGFL